jgi:hypothetical protein
LAQITKINTTNLGMNGRRPKVAGFDKWMATNGGRV